MDIFPEPVNRFSKFKQHLEPEKDLYNFYGTDFDVCLSLHSSIILMFRVSKIIVKDSFLKFCFLEIIFRLFISLTTKFEAYRRIHHVKFLTFHDNNWSIMAARAQMEQVKLEEFNLKGTKSTAD